MKSNKKKCTDKVCPGVTKMLLKLLLCLSCLTIVSAGAEDLIVFTSEDSFLRPGDVVKSDVVVTLKEGQSLTLIAKNGKVIKLSGDYQGLPLSNSGENTRELTDALKALMVSQASSDDLGVTRDTTDIIKTSAQHGWVPEPWVIDITRSGDFCVQQDRPVVLWRPKSTAGALQLTTGSGYKASTQWPEGEHKIATPSDLPVINGENYQFSLASKQYSTTWHVIPDTIDNANVVASWMLEKGCKAQAMALLR